ncbi:MAG: hypothetical protein KDD11_23695 [Acidobacteria bacterium]|nr:hypothetical protein [Acidobacteriota bacterium]
MAKCDFQFSMSQSVINPAEWKLSISSLQAFGVLHRLDSVQAKLPRGQALVASDKCDWSVRMVQDKVGKFRQPQLSALMSADKCDFRVNLEFGLDQGRAFRVGAVSSDKCDFRIERFQTYDPAARMWKAAEIAGDSPKKA